MSVDAKDKAGIATMQATTGLRISTDASELDIPMIHRFLSEESGWANGIPIALVEKSVRHSLCFGGYLGQAQIAFARVISDFATFANLVDVFVLREHRGNQYGRQIIGAVMSHPDLQHLRRFTLATADSHGLYARFAFASPSKPETLMERYAPDVYRKP